MNQHYVSQFYLRKWDIGKLYVYVMQTDKNHPEYSKILKKSIKHVCSKKDIYEPKYECIPIVTDQIINGVHLTFPIEKGSFEGEFGKIESVAGKVIDHILRVTTRDNLRSALICGESDKNAIAKYIAMQTLRHPSSLKTAIKDGKELVYKEMEDCKQNFYGFDSEVLKVLLHAVHDTHLSHAVLKQIPHYSKKIISEKVFCFYLGGQFITTEVPVLLSETYSGVIPNIWFPLSPTVGLYLCDKGGDLSIKHLGNRLAQCSDKIQCVLNYATTSFAARNKMKLIGSDKKLIFDLWNQYYADKQQGKV